MRLVVNAKSRPFYLRETEPLPTAQKAVWAPERSGQTRKISPPTGFDHRTVQPVVSRHIDCAIPEYYGFNFLYPYLLLCTSRCKTWAEHGKFLINTGFKPVNFRQAGDSNIIARGCLNSNISFKILEHF